MAMSCYAYFKPPAAEDLDQHHVEVLQTLEGLPEFRQLVTILETRFDVPRREAEKCLRLAALTHDIGKIDKSYQDDCARGSCTSFPGHYEKSARLLAMAYAIAHDDKSIYSIHIDEIQLGEPAGRFLALVVLPVELHHYAQIEQLQPQHELKPGCTLSKTLDEAEKIWPEVGRALREILSQVEVGLPPVEALSQLRQIRQRVDTVHIIEAAAGLVNIADGRTAKRNRVNRDA